MATADQGAADQGAADQGMREAGDLGPAEDGDAGSTQPMLELLAGKPGGRGNVDGVGAAARFYRPSALVSDGTENVYVADTNNDTIRRIVVSTGAVTTLAGTPGITGSTDGTGSAAQFGRPAGIAFDGVGVLYVADTVNHTIRKLVLGTRAVTTVAGAARMSGNADGTGDAARFNSPAALAWDGARLLYVADSNNGTIRRLDVATGAVTTLSDGGGDAIHFARPSGVAVDGAGNLYVAAAGDDTVQQVQLATGVVTTIAGAAGQTGSIDGPGAAARFNGPNGLALDGAGQLYITELYSHALRKLVLSTGVVTTVAGAARISGSADGIGAAARFSDLTGVGCDAAGRVYAADSGNHTIRAIDPATAAVATLAGAADAEGYADGYADTARFRHPSGVTADEAGNVYVADTDNQTVRKIELATGLVTTIAGTAGVAGTADGVGGDARFRHPAAVAADGAGYLYVADTEGQTIRRVALATSEVTTIAGMPGMVGSEDGTGAAARFADPSGIAADRAGHVYVGDTYNHTIRKVVAATGEVTTLAGMPEMAGSADGTGAAARFDHPCGVALDDFGNLYVADWFNETIRKVVLSTGEVTTLAGMAGINGSADGSGTDARFFSPQGIGVDALGTVYIADLGNHAIRKLSVATGKVTTWVGNAGQVGDQPGPLPASLGMPIGVARTSDGAWVIADYMESSLFIVH